MRAQIVGLDATIASAKIHDCFGAKLRRVDLRRHALVRVEEEGRKDDHGRDVVEIGASANSQALLLEEVVEEIVSILQLLAQPQIVAAMFDPNRFNGVRRTGMCSGFPNRGSGLLRSFFDMFGSNRQKRFAMRVWERAGRPARRGNAERATYSGQNPSEIASSKVQGHSAGKPSSSMAVSFAAFTVARSYA